MLGTQVGFKFNPDGSPARYPGNTVVCDVNPDNPAYPILREIVTSIDKNGLSPLLIKLPCDSYHVTIMRGLNDKVRTPKFWPPELSTSCTLADMDSYVREKLKGIPFSVSFPMVFSRLQWSDEDVRVCLAPSCQEAERALRSLRDAMADRLGLRLPGHEHYTFHVTLAYVHYRAQERDAAKIAQITDDFFVRHSGAALEIGAPRLAFYEDMMEFPAERKRS
jgi:hypothetical protein